MKYNDFKKDLPKGCFSLEEAKRVAFGTSALQLKVQLHQWMKKGDIVALKKGLYAFPERIQDKTQVARVLYEPSYLSLEYALHFHGLIPDVPFAMTLVTPKITRSFQNFFGLFEYHKMKQDLFWGFDPDTLMGEREKVLLDFFYLNQAKFREEPDAWNEWRFQNLDRISFKKLMRYAKKFNHPKVMRLALFLKNIYGKNAKNHS